MIIANFVAIRVESVEWHPWRWDLTNLPFAAIAIILVLSFSIWWLTAHLDRKNRR
jgi:hypothetical protein